MFIEELRNIKSTPAELKKFGLLVGSVLLLIATLAWWNGGQHSVSFFAIGLLLVVLGLLFPIMLKPLQKAWMVLALVLGFLSTRIIITFVYFLVVSPLAIILRILGKRFLDIPFEKNRSSYWAKRHRTTLPKKNYEQQF